MTTTPSATTLGRLRDEVQRRLPDYLTDLETIVNIESGSYTKSGVDEVANWIAGRLANLGAAIEWDRNEELGDTAVATLEGSAGGPTILLIGHTDTVFDPGFLAKRPFGIDRDRIVGPGVSDMKSGLLTGLYAIDALLTVLDGKQPPFGRLIYIVNPDEEIGSPASVDLIAKLAQGADAAFVMEAARANGDIVSARKGMMHIRATIQGRSAHAGVEPEKGRSATLEAAHKTIALHALNGRWSGVSVNVGEIKGGTRPNIVAEEAVMTIDMRARLAVEQDEAEAAIYEILESSVVPDICDHDREARRYPPDGEDPGIGRARRCRSRHRRRAGVRAGRCRDRRGIGREHDGRGRRALGRRARAGGRQRPHAARVHREEQHRPEDDAARCVAAVSRRLERLERLLRRLGKLAWEETPSKSIQSPHVSWDSARESATGPRRRLRHEPHGVGHRPVLVGAR